MNLGSFLASAEKRLAEIGGYQAEACLGTRTVSLFFVDPASGVKTTCGTGPLADGQAIEDAARDVFDALKPTLVEEKIAFSNIYFPIGFART